MGVEKSKSYRRRQQLRARAQERSWAARSGPVVVSVPAVSDTPPPSCPHCGYRGRSSVPGAWVGLTDVCLEHDDVCPPRWRCSRCWLWVGGPVVAADGVEPDHGAAD